MASWPYYYTHKVVNSLIRGVLQLFGFYYDSCHNAYVNVKHNCEAYLEFVKVPVSYGTAPAIN